MSPSRERLRRLAVALVLTAGPHQPTPPGTAGPVEDVVGAVESLDGTESELQQGRTVTVALTSDVLFAFDRADLTGGARTRLEWVAEKIETESTGGPVRIEGHTDDQGGDAYNDDLSQRRADAVRDALAELLGELGGGLEATGRGEREPRVPNVVEGEPSEENRARNRRVEIVFDTTR